MHVVQARCVHAEPANPSQNLFLHVDLQQVEVQRLLGVRMDLVERCEALQVGLIDQI
jgi:hypothetical protein